MRELIPYSDFTGALEKQDGKKIMALLLPNSVFIHTPKTGGVWVETVLVGEGLVVGPLGLRHAKGPDVTNTREFQERAVSFTFVRHPLSWYQSYWSYKEKDGWNDPDNEFDQVVKSHSFLNFLRNVIIHFPGYFSGATDRFTAGVIFVGKQERLTSDLLLALTLAGEAFDPVRIRAVTPRNVASGETTYKARCMYSPKLADKIMEVERKAVALYGYDYIPEGIVDSTLRGRYFNWL